MRGKHKAEADLIPPVGLGGYVADGEVVPDSNVTPAKPSGYCIPANKDSVWMRFEWEGRIYEGTAYCKGEVMAR